MSESAFSDTIFSASFSQYILMFHFMLAFFEACFVNFGNMNYKSQEHGRESIQ